MVLKILIRLFLEHISSNGFKSNYPFIKKDKEVVLVSCTFVLSSNEKEVKQAGAELCQAQVTLGLAMLELLSTKLRSSSLC
jgi:cytochrome oxidase assembly protein ShyY1